MTKLRILSYNIHKGFSSQILKYTLESMRAEIRRIHPDIIFLQEVHGQYRGHKRRLINWPEISQFEFLAQDFWPHFSYGKNAVYPKGHHGNAILSRFPIVSWENVDISKNSFERKGLLHATIEIEKGAPLIHAVCVHLGLFEGSRQKQVDDLIRHINQFVSPSEKLVVAGDFNDWRKRADKQLADSLNLGEVFLKLNGAHAKTFPAFAPILRLDRVYCRGVVATKAKALADAPWPGLSDHIPLFVEIRV